MKWIGASFVDGAIYRANPDGTVTEDRLYPKETEEERRLRNRWRVLARNWIAERIETVGYFFTELAHSVRWRG